MVGKAVSSGDPPALQSLSQDEGAEQINLLRFPMVFPGFSCLQALPSAAVHDVTITSNSCCKSQVLGKHFFCFRMVSSLPGLGHCSIPTWSWGSGIEAAEHSEQSMPMASAPSL